MSSVEYNEKVPIEDPDGTHFNEHELEKDNGEKVEEVDPEYYEPLKHEGWKDLREKPRWCTDVIFAILIIVSWFVMTIVGLCATGVIQTPRIPAGDPNRLIFPTDYQGSICGHSSGVEGKRYGYYLPDRTAVCVESCPVKTDYNNFICRYDAQAAADNSTMQGWQSVAQYDCMYQIKTVSFVRRCWPDISVSTAADEASTQAASYGVDVYSLYSTSANGNSDWFNNFIADMYSLMGYIFGFGIGVTIGVAFLYLFLLQVKGLLNLVLWTVILGVLVFLLLGSFLLWSLANQWEDDDVHSDPEVLTMRVFAYCGLGLSLLYFCIIVVLRKRIQLAIGIVKQAARALTSMPNIYFVPFLQALGLVCFLLPWVVYVLALASSGKEETKTFSYTYEGETFSYTYRAYTYRDNTKWAFLYMLFCWFWTSEFLIALGQIIVALAFSLWYFSRDKKTVGWSGVNWAIFTGIFYHAGTAAFGSLFVAIVKTVRAVLLYVQKQARKYKNKVLEYLLCMIGCLLWCLEKLIKFINKNAYVITAIYGYGFCTATRKAFWLIMRNILRVSAVGVISFLLLLIGRLFVPLATTVLCYFAIAYTIPSGNVHGIIAPLVFTFLLSYWVTSMFLEIYGMGIETILICFIADEEMFDVKDRFAEGELRSTIDKTSQLHKEIKEGKKEDSISKQDTKNT